MHYVGVDNIYWIAVIWRIVLYALLINTMVARLASNNSTALQFGDTSSKLADLIDRTGHISYSNAPVGNEVSACTC